MSRLLAVVAAHAAVVLGCAPSSTTTGVPAPVAPSTVPDRLPPGCDSPAYHRLDFWIGTWDVTDPRGAYEGTNVVVPVLGRCAIEEHWVDARGHRGDSLFVVDRVTGTWRQTWVTDEGRTKEKREVAGAPAGGIRFEGPDRTTLTPQADGAVRQLIEAPAGSWEGIYRRIPGQCETPEHHQMDFWLGDWSVRVRSRVAPGKDEWAEGTGSNHLVSILAGCVIEESFRATGGPGGATWAGRSWSTWLPAEKRWRQTWVDDSGSYLTFTGGMQNGEMVLVGEPRPDGRVMRMVFGEIGPRHVAWRWEGSTDGQKTWVPAMLIEYTRIGR